ncbi:MAG: hypothetical protein AB7U61_09880 [Methylocystis sp.]
MIDSYAAAHKRINNILELFIALCATAFTLAMLYDQAKFGMVWFFSGMIAVVIEAWPTRSSLSGRSKPYAEYGATADVVESVEAGSFCHKYLRLSFLLAVTTLLLGTVLAVPIWSSCMASIFAWFASMLCVPVLCAPRDATEL